MASYNNSNNNNGYNEIRQLERTLSTLLNKQLQQICVTHGMSRSGVKAELQGRIKKNLIDNYTANPAVFREIQATIQGMVRGSSGHTPQPNMPGSSSNNGHHGHNNYPPGREQVYTPPPYQFTGTSHTPQSLGGYATPSSAGNSTLRYYKNAHQALRDLQFKPSPFYSITMRIGDIRTCEMMTQHRNTVTLIIRVSDYPELGNLINDKTYRVMLFCAGDNTTVQDIAFPHQSEFKVNEGEVKANLRGLKGKPGTTRPVDITDSLRLKPANYENKVEFTYALTNKVKKHDPSPAGTKFYLAAYLCKMVSVDELVTKIRGRKIAKDTVIQEMAKKANDPDVVATSTVLSLKCPLSYMRIRTPCRSVLCNHIQCFDASSYLQLQEQGPQWICPVCNKSAPFENLAIDDVDIDDDVSVVTDNPSYSNGGYGNTPHPYGTPSRSFIGGLTPSSGSREPSTAPRSASKKRPAAEVIDLTLSSDEDDAPIVRTPKKQKLGPPSNAPYSYAPGLQWQVAEGRIEDVGEIVS
ncbi:hypothetical protein O1611_g8742 [Lasiodiplodia mahajangana]|uniref:Uncharacterized protein n=1 Tax=Lasiodiplodia mahajangana TaxID=1108764 RepID=A0ACC2JC30_9PEZI|nr:hypothetical protein O1611_g8742 [Lasiodiplodia mahajangana]